MNLAVLCSDNFFFLLSVSVPQKKKKKALIKPVSVPQVLCAVCVCALVRFLLLLVGCGLAAPCMLGASLMGRTHET